MELLVVSLLILMGALLLVAEVALIPGFGISGILGVLSMIAAVAYSFLVFNSLAGAITLLIVIMVCVALILWAIYGNTLDRMSLKKNIDSAVQNPEAAGLAVGDCGVSLTRLALVGEADFNGRMVEVTSCDGLIDEKNNVKIVRISGGVVFVKKM